MKYIDLGNSFNNFKTQFMSNKLFDETNNEYYNLGVEKCINFVRSQAIMYRMIDEHGLAYMAVDAILKSLEYFKKPEYKKVNQDDIADVI